MSNLYRKKPAVIEAHQWFKNGDHPDDNCGTFTGSDGKPFQGEGHVIRYYRTPECDGQDACKHCGSLMHDHGWIDGRQEDTVLDHNVCPGDWIITGVEGEYYPCKPDIFEATYEKVAKLGEYPIG